jgi:hypothetical protein
MTSPNARRRAKLIEKELERLRAEVGRELSTLQADSATA